MVLQMGLLVSMDGWKFQVYLLQDWNSHPDNKILACGADLNGYVV